MVISVPTSLSIDFPVGKLSSPNSIFSTERKPWPIDRGSAWRFDCWKRHESTLVIGWFRPVILVPLGMVTGMPAVQLDAVLLHELAHIRRHDYLVNALQVMIETLLFYHPAMWWLSRRIRTEREYCCDDIAVAGCGSNLNLAKALAALETARFDNPLAWPRVELERRKRR